MGKEFDEKVKEFLSRPVEEENPYIFVDTSHYKVKDKKAGRYETKAILAVIEVREDGCGGILGVKLADSEKNFDLNSLKS